nr:MAG TPA: hypothetical protein [Caudoviricetes sp.]
MITYIILEDAILAFLKAEAEDCKNRVKYKERFPADRAIEIVRSISLTDEECKIEALNPY